MLRQTALAGGVLAGMLVFNPIDAEAQTRTWTGTVSADATSSANWQGGNVPGNAADVVVTNYTNSPPTITGTINWRTLLINLPNTGFAGQHTVTFSNVAGQTTSIAQPGSPIHITVRNGALDIANSSVTINSAQLVSGSSGSITTEAGGTVYNRGTVSVQVNNAGHFTNYSGGSIRAGIVNTGGTVDANGNPTTLVGFVGDKAGFINAGTLDCRPTVCVGVFGQSTRTVQNSGYFQNLNTGVIMEGLYTSAGYVENLGTINHSTAVAGGIFANGRRFGDSTAEDYLSGTVADLSVTGGEFRNVSGSVTGAVTNFATIRNSGVFSGSVTNSGTFHNERLPSLLASGGTDKVGSVTGSFTNSGLGTLINSAAMSNVGVNGGTVENRLGGTIAALTNNAGTINNFGSISNPNVIGGVLINKSGGTINGLGIGIGQSGVFTNEAGGTVNGTVTTSGADRSGRVNANLGRITGNLTVDAGTFIQAGTLDGAVFVNGGTLILGGQVGETFSDGNLAANLRGTGSTVQNNGRIAFNGGVDTVTVASVIQGSGIVEQRGNNGHTILTGDNTYTGKTIVTAGRLQISGASASNEFEVNGSLTLNRDTNTSFTGSVTGTGNFVKGGTGSMTLDSHLQNTGTVGVNAGTLSIGTGGSIANTAKIATSAGATFDLGSAARTVGGINGQGGTVSGNGTITIDAAAGSITQYSGVISGAGRALVKTGAGQQELYGTNTFDGGVTISGGVLKVGSEAALGTAATTTITVASGASLGLGSIATSQGGDFSFSKVIAGEGGLIKSGNNTVTLTGANTYTGTTRVEAGTLKLGAGGSLSAQSSLVVLAGATFDVGATNQTIGSLSGVGGTVSGSGSLTVQLANDETVAGNPLSGFSSFDKQGATTLSLTGNLNYSGQVRISGGTLVLSGNNTLVGGIQVSGTLVLGASGAAGGAGNRITTTGSTIQYGGGNMGDPPVNNAAPITIASDTTKLSVLANNSPATQSGVISEDVAPRPLEKIGAGTLILSGANTYTGVTTITEGALNIQNATGLGTTAGGTVVVAGAALELEGGVAIGAEALTLNGTGVTNGGALRSVSGTNTFGGAITLASDASIVSVAAGGTLTLSGGITLGANRLTLGGSSGGIEITAAITGSGGVTVDRSSGLVDFNAANTYMGGTTLTQGGLRVGSGGTLGAATSALTVNGGALTLATSVTVGSLAGTGGTIQSDLNDRVLTVNGSATTSFSGALTDNGSGKLKALFTGGGTTTLSGTNTLTGGIEIAGTATRVNFATTASTGGSTNTVTLAGTNTVLGLTASTNATYANPIALTGTGVKIDVGANDYTQSGVISGTSGFEKLGTGTLILGDTMVNPTHTYSGATRISAGTVRFRSSANLGNDSATNRLILNGGKLETSGNIGIAMARPVEITALNGTLDNVVELTLNGATTFTGTLTKTGAGTLTLNGAGTGAGGLVFNSSGILEIGSNTALGTGTLRLQSGGTLRPGAASVSLANAVVIDAATAVSTPTGRALTLSGAISGAGSITKSNPGTLDLTGANSFTGGVTLAAGTLGVGSNTALGTAGLRAQVGTTLRAVANATLANNIVVTPGEIAGTQFIVDTNGSNLTLSGVISKGVGFKENVEPGLTKNGAGTLTLSGVNTYRGATIVNAGTLVVNGSINASSGITIAQGATLGGTGATPTLTVNGTISPGNSVGVLNINGGLTLASTATTVIEIEGATADRINVTGNATLNGTLQLVAGGGAYAFATPYTILTTTGTRTGTFATITTVGSFGVGVTSAVSYGAQNVQVTLTAAPLVTTPGATTTANTVLAQQTPVLGLTQTRNITAVASALDRALFSGSDLSSLFNVYNQPTREALAAAVNTLSGEVHTATSAAGLRASDQFLRVMLDPFAIGRDGSLVGLSGYSGFTADLPGRKGPVAAPTPVRFEPTFHVWGASFGQIDRTRGDAVGAGSATREIRDANIAVGADYRIAPGSVIGFALSGGQSRAELGRNLGANTADIFQLGLYGATRIGKLNLAASLSYAAMQVETRRSVPALGLNPTADYSAHVWGGRLQGSYDLFSAGGFTMSPIAALQVQSVLTPNFREINSFTGAAAGVTGRSHTNTALRSELGLRVTSLTALGGRKVTLFTEIAWAHYYQRDITFAASIAGVANTNFVIEGARANRDAALFSAGADIQLTPNLTLGGRFDASASGNSRSYAGTGALRASF